MCVCGGIFLVDGPMHLKASGFYQCSAGWGAANREDKISTLISSSRSDVCQGGKKNAFNIQRGWFLLVLFRVRRASE